MEHEADLSGPTLIEETPQMPTKIKQSKKQRMEDSKSLLDGSRLYLIGIVWYRIDTNGIDNSK